MHELFLWKAKKALQLLILLKKTYMSLISHQTNYGYINKEYLTKDKWNHGYRIMIWKCIQGIMKENMLLVKHLSEPLRKYRNFSQFPGVEILWKGIGSTWFWANCPKLSKNCAFPWNVHTRNLVEITRFFAVNLKR